VQEEADAIADAEFAQSLRQRNHVVVVHPQDVVLAQLGASFPRTAR
jgi:hypothetical protein